MKKELYLLDALRIIATVGVFTGHYLGKLNESELAGRILAKLRNGIAGKTIFSYLFMGDMDVKVFYILGGFFVAYGLNKYNNLTENF